MKATIPRPILHAVVVGRRRGAAVVDPAFRQDAAIVPDAIAEVEVSEARPVLRAGVDEAAPHELARRVELGDHGLHAEGEEEFAAHEFEPSPLVFAHRAPGDGRQDLAGSRGVGPVGSGRVLDVHGLGEGRGVAGAPTEHQLADEEGAGLEPVFVAEARRHVEQIVEGYLAARIPGCLPGRHRGRCIDDELPHPNQDPHQGLSHALRHRPGVEAARRPEALGVAFVDDASSANDQERAGVAQAAAPHPLEEARRGLLERRPIQAHRELAPRPRLGRPRQTGGMSGQRHPDLRERPLGPRSEREEAQDRDEPDQQSASPPRQDAPPGCPDHTAPPRSVRTIGVAEPRGQAS